MSNVVAIKYLVAYNTNLDDDYAALEKLAALVDTHLKNGWCIKGPVVPVLKAQRLPKYIQTMVKLANVASQVSLPTSDDTC
jgi:hypothetical protein